MQNATGKRRCWVKKKRGIEEERRKVLRVHIFHFSIYIFMLYMNIVLVKEQIETQRKQVKYKYKINDNTHTACALGNLFPCFVVF